MKQVIYNAVHRMKSSPRLRSCSFLLLLLFWCGISGFGADWAGPVTQLAKAIASSTGPGTVTVSVVNASSLPNDQVPEIRRTLEAQLQSSGVRVGPSPSVSGDVHVTLSENLREYVWVAEIKQDNDTHVEMVRVPRARSGVAPRNAATVSVRKALLWSQPSQILDVMLLDASTPNPKMVVLDRDAVTIYALREGRWQREQNLVLAHTRTFPRDLRGLLFAGKDKSIETYLPGIVCAIASPPANAVTCRESDDAWKIGQRSAFFNSARNYFTGALVPASDKIPEPFYSMTWMNQQNDQLSLSVGIDGRVRVTAGEDQQLLPMATTADWGSDIAAVRSNCGAGDQLLVTSAVDDTSTDSIRAYEFSGHDPVLTSTAADFAGPITALWSHDATSATAVVHNLQTGQYEAYSVSINCY